MKEETKWVLILKDAKPEHRFVFFDGDIRTDMDCDKWKYAKEFDSEEEALHYASLHGEEEYWVAIPVGFSMEDKV